MKKDKRFAQVVVVGHGEGSTVGMVAAKRAKAEGFVSLAGPGIPPWKLIREQLAALPVEEGEDRVASERTWDSILDSLKAGRPVPSISEGLQSLFRPSVQPYLISWFSFDPGLEIGKVGAPVQIIQGGNDLRVGPEDASALSAGAKTAREDFLPDMNHVLKTVLPIDEDNWAASSDPAYPLTAGLAAVIAQFIDEKVKR
jgi:uncharacterized protein